MNLFANPFTNELFIEVALRLLILFSIGGIAIAVVAKRAPRLSDELWKRYRSWAVIAPVFLISVFCGTVPAALIFTSVMFRAVKEFATVARLNLSFQTIMMLLVPVSLIVVATDSSISILPPLYILVFTVAAIRTNKKEALQQLAVALMGSLWLVYLMLHAPLLKESANGVLITCLTGCSVALADIGAYTFGGILGKLGFGNRWKVASNISPNKTVPGYLGASIGVIGVLALFGSLIKDLNLALILLFPVVLPIAAAIGDLGESLFKRFYDVKDSAQVIPGHGGILDRLDSFIPAVTALYYLNAIL